MTPKSSILIKCNGSSKSVFVKCAICNNEIDISGGVENCTIHIAQEIDPVYALGSRINITNLSDSSYRANIEIPKMYCSDKCRIVDEL